MYLIKHNMKNFKFSVSLDFKLLNISTLKNFCIQSYYFTVRKVFPLVSYR